MASSLFGGLREKFDKMMEARREAALQSDPLEKMMRERAQRSKEQFARVVADMVTVPDTWDGVTERVQKAAIASLATLESWKENRDLLLQIQEGRLGQLSRTDNYEMQHNILLGCKMEKWSIPETVSIVEFVTQHDPLALMHFVAWALSRDFGKSFHTPDDRMGGARFEAMYPKDSLERANLLAYIHALKRDSTEFEFMLSIFHAHSFSGTL